MLADPELKKIHPLGKSPVITVETPGAAQPLVLAESGAMVEYLTDYYGKWLTPKRYIDGKEGKIGGETESWLRSRYFMHYAEGSLMTLMLVAFLVASEQCTYPFYRTTSILIVIGSQISKIPPCHSSSNQSRV